MRLRIIMRGKITMTNTDINSTITAASISAATSHGYSDRSHALRAMKAFASKNKMSPDDFVVEKIGSKHHFKPAPRGITSPAPKAVSSDVASAIKTFNDGIPAALKIAPEERKAAWDKQPPRTSARTALPKSATDIKQDDDLKKQISAAAKKPANPVKVAKPKKATRGRIDWSEIELSAKKGTLPPPPDMSAPTHKYYRSKLDDLVKLVKGGELKQLQNYNLGDREDGSPRLLKLYRRVAVIALKAKAAA